MNTVLTILAPVPGLNPGGWIMLIGCIGLVLALCTFCFYKILTEKDPEEHHHVPLDIDTHDTEG